MAQRAGVSLSVALGSGNWALAKTLLDDGQRPSQDDLLTAVSVRVRVGDRGGWQAVADGLLAAGLDPFEKTGTDSRIAGGVPLLVAYGRGLLDFVDAVARRPEHGRDKVLSAIMDHAKNNAGIGSEPFDAPGVAIKNGQTDRVLLLTRLGWRPLWPRLRKARTRAMAAALLASGADSGGMGEGSPLAFFCSDLAEGIPQREKTGILCELARAVSDELQGKEWGKRECDGVLAMANGASTTPFRTLVEKAPADVFKARDNDGFGLLACALEGGRLGTAEWLLMTRGARLGEMAGDVFCLALAALPLGSQDGSPGRVSRGRMRMLEAAKAAGLPAGMNVAREVERAASNPRVGRSLGKGAAGMVNGQVMSWICSVSDPTEPDGFGKSAICEAFDLCRFDDAAGFFTEPGTKGFPVSRGVSHRALMLGIFAVERALGKSAPSAGELLSSDVWRPEPGTFVLSEASVMLDAFERRFLNSATGGAEYFFDDAKSLSRELAATVEALARQGLGLTEKGSDGQAAFETVARMAHCFDKSLRVGGLFEKTALLLANAGLPTEAGAIAAGLLGSDKESVCEIGLRVCKALDAEGGLVLPSNALAWSNKTLADRLERDGMMSALVHGAVLAGSSAQARAKGPGSV